ncbi:hypothetical protein BB561_003142 [Smittium simulii]|uniref:PUM-HD domain-containing protein n=1 Tax=Smittium simulii TaxID=133385 RepID=A0A2T9YMU0_9FUNG|nr:hypothetical protein BB561_003142 [Smittium simulii]
MSVLLFSNYGNNSSNKSYLGKNSTMNSCLSADLFSGGNNSGFLLNFGNQRLGSLSPHESPSGENSRFGYSTPMDRKRKSEDSGKDVAFNSLGIKVTRPPGFDINTPNHYSLGKSIFDSSFNSGLGIGNSFNACATNSNLNYGSINLGIESGLNSNSNLEFKQDINIISNGYNEHVNGRFDSDTSEQNNEGRVRSMFQELGLLDNPSKPLEYSRLDRLYTSKKSIPLSTKSSYNTSNNTFGSDSESLLNDSSEFSLLSHSHSNNSEHLSASSHTSTRYNSPLFNLHNVSGYKSKNQFSGNYNLESNIHKQRNLQDDTYNYLSIEPRHAIDDTLDVIWGTQNRNQIKNTNQDIHSNDESKRISPQQFSTRQHLFNKEKFVSQNYSKPNFDLSAYFEPENTFQESIGNKNFTTKSLLETKLQKEFDFKYSRDIPKNINKKRPEECQPIKVPEYWFSIDEKSSRNFQSQIDTWRLEYDSLLSISIVNKMIDNIVEITKSEFGNFVIQKLVVNGDIKTVEKILDRIKAHIVDFSKNEYGCRVIQRLLEFTQNRNDHQQQENNSNSNDIKNNRINKFQSPKQHSIDLLSDKIQTVVLREIKPFLMDCIFDISGNHVVQKIICTFNPQLLGFIFKEAAENQMSISTNRFGCHVMQKLVEMHSTNTMFIPILKSINSQIPILIIDKFGNYVLQQIIKNSTAKDVNDSEVVSYVINNFVKCSKHKIASNVVELSLPLIDEKKLSKIIYLVFTIEDTRKSKPLLIELIQDKFANYVIQKLLVAVKDSDFKALATLITKFLPEIRTISSTKNFVTKFQKIMDLKRFI